MLIGLNEMLQDVDWHVVCVNLLSNRTFYAINSPQNYILGLFQISQPIVQTNNFFKGEHS